MKFLKVLNRCTLDCEGVVKQVGCVDVLQHVSKLNLFSMTTVSNKRLASSPETTQPKHPLYHVIKLTRGTNWSL